LEEPVIMLGILNEVDGKEGGLLNAMQYHKAMLVLSNNRCNDSTEPSREYSGRDFV
jgi:hypothetical protein